MKQDLNSLISTIAQALVPYHADSSLRQRLAFQLIGYVTGKSREQIVVQAHAELSAEQEHALKQALDDLLRHHKPLAYILGTCDFAGLYLEVKPPVLIPRVETEWWTIELIKRLAPYAQADLQILDLCTGCGCVALALAKAFPNSRVIGSDISPAALDLARRNAQRLGISNISFVASDLFSAFTHQKFDLIVSNPPYVPTSAQHKMPRSVLEWEDPGALFAGHDGMLLINNIIARAPSFLQHRFAIPQLVLEVDASQRAALSLLAKKYNCSEFEIIEDQFGRDRVFTGKWQQ